MLDFGFYNMDCMDGMKEFPDKFFDLAIVDPPYGDGGGSFANGERFGQRFDRYRKNTEGGVARKAEVLPRYTDSGTRENGVSRTGGKWAAKYGKKSSRGTSPRISRILTNCFASHGTRLSGGAITFICRRLGAS